MSESIINQKITYVQTQDKILYNNNISSQARITYQILAKHCHSNKITCFPSLKRIAAKVGKSTRSIIRYINELVSAGLVKRTNRGHHSNMYTLFGLIAWDESTNQMVELDESNCNTNKTTSITKKAISTVQAIAKRNISTYKNKKVNNKIGAREDEYTLGVNEIREMLSLDHKKDSSTEDNFPFDE